MEGQNVLFKGTKNGVIITVNESSIENSDFENIKSAIEEKICRSKDFFKSGNVYMDFSKTNIDEEHQDEIKEIVYRDCGIIIQNMEEEKEKVFDGISEGKTKFIISTLRSGQGIDYPGNVVLIGDINAGAEVKAGGNIIVMGTLRGMVHAGTSGNQEAIIAAFSLQPTQLRIADIISRPPDGEIIKPKCPELARIKDGYIIIEPYIPNKQY